MSSINHKYNSSVVKHMLANPKVRGSILTQAELSFCGHALEFTRVFKQKLQE